MQKQIIYVVCLSFLWMNQAFSEQQEDSLTLKVIIKPSEPWVMYGAEDAPEARKPVGFSIDLWQGIAKELGAKTEWIYADTMPELLDAVIAEQADVGISAITIRHDREQVLDFSTSMFDLGLQIMVNAEAGVVYPGQVFVRELHKLLTPFNLSLFAIMLFIAANLRWLADRFDPHGEPLFPKHYWMGIYEAFWWSLTMLITWEVPKRKGFARLIDLTWHLTGLMGLSIMTAIIAASLTTQTVAGSIHNEKDLPGRLVAAVATNAPRDYLQKIGAKVVPVATLNEGIEMLLRDEVEALVHDGPRLLYLANQINLQSKTKVQVLPATFNRQNYGLVLPENSPHLEHVNQALLKLREPRGLEPSYHDQLLQKWIPKH